jgi:hypothetical protein
MRRYPWLSSADFKDRSTEATGESIMRSVDKLVIIEDGDIKLGELGM